MAAVPDFRAAASKRSSHLFYVAAVGHANRNAKTHARIAIGPVRHRRIDELRVRHDHGDVVVGQNDGAAGTNLLHLSGDAGHFDAVADRDRPFRQNDEAADEIARDILQTEADADADCAGKNGERAEMNAGVLEDDENADDQDDVADDLRDRVLERAIEAAVDEEAIEEKSLRARGNPEDRDQQRDRAEKSERG